MSEPSDFGAFGRIRRDARRLYVAGDARRLRVHQKASRARARAAPDLARQILSPPKTIVPIGGCCQKRSTLTKTEIEIVTQITTARWMSAYASYEHEKIGEEQGHLPAATMERMVAGLPVSFEDPRQAVVYELASALVTPRISPLGLYRRAN